MMEHAEGIYHISFRPPPPAHQEWRDARRFPESYNSHDADPLLMLRQTTRETFDGVHRRPFEVTPRVAQFLSNAIRQMMVIRLLRIAGRDSLESLPA